MLAVVTGGIPAKDMGPINEWWVSGFDGGERALIGFSTAFGEYYLMEPSEAYAPLMESVKEKIYMGKLVIEFLLDEENASYEDLLNKLQVSNEREVHFHYFGIRIRSICPEYCFSSKYSGTIES